MTRAEPSRKTALDDFLNLAADELSRSTRAGVGNDVEGLLFLGAWHQSYPAILVRDPFLSDSAKVQFLYLMQESCQKPQGAIAMPSLDETARMLGHSRRTVLRDRTLLRVCRWISVCRSVRDRSGRFLGSIYAIHSEPCSLAEGGRLDQGYLDLLSKCRTHRDPFLQYAAQAALDGIDKALDEGRDPLAAPDTISRRLNAAAAIRNGSGTFFDLLLGGKRAANDSSESADSETEAQNGLSYPQNANFAPRQPGANFSPRQIPPSANFALGQQATDSMEDTKSYPQTAKFAPGYSCCCCISSNTETTTTDEARRENSAIPPSVNALRWPEQFDNSQRGVIDRAIMREGIPAERRQQIIDVLAHKALDAGNPLRNPAGYAIKLCRRVKAGQFQPIPPPASTTSQGACKVVSDADKAKRELREMRAERQSLRSEITALEENLIPMADPKTRQTLEASRDRYQARLGELDERCKTLRGRIDGADVLSVSG